MAGGSKIPGVRRNAMMLSARRVPALLLQPDAVYTIRRR